MRQKKLSHLNYAVIFLMTVFLSLYSFISAPVGYADDEVPSDNGLNATIPEQNSTVELFLPALFVQYNPYPTTPPFGVQMYGNTSDTSRYYSELVESRASWVRARIRWDWVEPTNRTPDQYDWEKADTVVGGVRDAGVNMIVTLEYAPNWAATYPNGRIDKVDLSEFTDYVEALVERYDGDGVDDAPGSPRVEYWEFYNEPDVGSLPGNVRWGHYGAEYAQLLEATYPVVKAADPTAQVVLGGLAYDWFDDDGGPFIRRFLDDILEAGGGAFFDVMNFHYYPAFAGNWVTSGPGMLGKARYIREKLAEYGLEKPLIVTETGWHNNSDADQPSTDDIQNRYVVELFTQGLAADIPIIIWWMLFDAGEFYPYNTGLTTNSDAPARKPSFSVYQRLVAELKTAHFDSVLTESEMGTSQMEAYRFVDHLQGSFIYVAWLNPVDTTETTSLQLPATRAKQRDIHGNETLILDQDDGAMDGQITVSISAQPSYIEVNLAEMSR